MQIITNNSKTMANGCFVSYFAHPGNVLECKRGERRDKRIECTFQREWRIKNYPASRKNCFQATEFEDHTQREGKKKELKGCW